MAERHEVNPETDFERDDMALKPVLYVGITVFLLITLVPVIIAYGFRKVQGDVDRTLTIQPPAPHLQTAAPADLARYLAQQRKLLDTAGWVDRAHGVAHEPIEEAMDQAVRRGLDGFPKPQPQGQEP